MQELCLFGHPNQSRVTKRSYMRNVKGTKFFIKRLVLKLYDAYSLKMIKIINKKNAIITNK